MPSRSPLRRHRRLLPRQQHRPRGSSTAPASRGPHFHAYPNAASRHHDCGSLAPDRRGHASASHSDTHAAGANAHCDG